VAARGVSTATGSVSSRGCSEGIARSLPRGVRADPRFGDTGFPRATRRALRTSRTLGVAQAPLYEVCIALLNAQPMGSIRRHHNRRRQAPRPPRAPRGCQMSVGLHAGAAAGAGNGGAPACERRSPCGTNGGVRPPPGKCGHSVILFVDLRTTAANTCIGNGDARLPSAWTSLRQGSAKKTGARSRRRAARPFASSIISFRRPL